MVTKLGHRTRFLQQLAHLYGIQTAYYDVAQHRQQASPEALLTTLQSLGAPVKTLDDVPSTWREKRQGQWQQLVEPVNVAWENKPLIIPLRLPTASTDAKLVGHLTLENGQQQSWEWSGTDLPMLEAVGVEGTRYFVKQLLLPGKLPRGYHRLNLEVQGKYGETLIIASPLKAYTPPEEQSERKWGVFAPLYALHSEKSWGGGDFSDLESLLDWVGKRKGNVVATLPLLSAFLDNPYEPSPYLPASRLLWNEFYLDISRIPELGKCPSAQSLLASLMPNEIKALRSLPLVDYRQQMLLKRQVLEELCRSLFAETSERLDSLHRFAETNPTVEDYARFRATGEKQGTSWRAWPQPLREGKLRKSDYHEENRRYHLYVQWLAHQQILTLSDKAKGKGLQLYFDLPLGVHPSGYDVWREPSLFAQNLSVGAPPDTVFTKGQNWDFPPLHPEKIREQGYRYTIAYLRHHLQHAGILRIDHVMSFHRLFCIPQGLEASQGVYVRYRPEELYAILALESQRYGSLIVGEDLGTVPPEVRPAMKRHGLQHMYVVHYELASAPRTSFYPVPRDSVASLNTHDMPPFASFWNNGDIAERLEIGLLNEEEAREEREGRQRIRQGLIIFLNEKGWLRESAGDIATVLKGCLAFLSGSRARVVLVNLEDLWRETQLQNIPGTREEYPNWRHKIRYNFEAFAQMPQVLDMLKMISRLRRQSRYENEPAKRAQREP